MSETKNPPNQDDLPPPSGVRETKKPRGLAALSPERRREIARLGGKAAQQTGKPHRFSSEEARQAGKKGGEKVSKDRDFMVLIGQKGGNKISQDKEHMAKIGQKGGKMVSQDLVHMKEIARLGGLAKNHNARKRKIKEN